MTRYLLVAVAFLILGTQCTEARSGCSTHSDLRRSGHHGYLRYNLVRGQRCWYDPSPRKTRQAKMTPKRRVTPAAVEEAAEPGVAPFSANVPSVADIQVRVVDPDRDPVTFVERWRAMRDPQTNLLWSPDSLMNSK